MSEKSEIGKRIKALRLERGYTQAQLAGWLTVSDSAVRMWELGKNEPDIATLNKLAVFLNVKIAALVSDEPKAAADDLFAEYGLDPTADAVLFRFMSDAKKENLSEADLRLALDFIKMARKREESELA